MSGAGRCEGSAGDGERTVRHRAGGPPRSDGLDVIVIGAGQAGLAMGAVLARRGLRFIILDAAAAVGSAWRERWDSLQLFTPARYSGLPGLRFPGDPDAYPSRDEVIAYLERYAERFRLPVVPNREATSLSARADGGYVVVAGGIEYAAEQVVVATGPFQVPLVPPIAAGLAPEVVHFHSVGYRNPSALPDGPLLVVGGGNTGVQIASELAGTREVHLSVGTRQTPLPQRLLGRDLFWWLTRLGLMEKSVDSRIGRRMKSRDPVLVGSSPRRLSRRRHVRLWPRAVAAAGCTVGFADGTALEVAAVIWATGFRVDHSWINVARDADGHVPHERGVAESPGLYFLGLAWQHTRGSALIGWVKDDAEFLAQRIDAHRARRGAAGPSGDGG